MLLVYCDGKLTKRALFTHRLPAQRAFDDPMRVEFYEGSGVLLDVCDGLWLEHRKCMKFFI